MFRRQRDDAPGVRSLKVVEPTRTAPAKAHEPTPATMPTLRLGTSIVIKGHLSASEDLTIHGHFEGEIEVRAHTVTVGNDGEVEAPIHAKCVVIEGAVHGDVTATNRVEIREAGRLDGAVVAPRIGIAPGAWVRGTVRTQAVDATPRVAESESAPVRPRKSPAA